MKLMPLIAPPGSPDELVWAIEAINKNFQDVEQIVRRGLRAPIGQPGLPSIGFQNTGFDGIGASGMQDTVTGVVQGILWESNAIRQRASSPATGAVAEIVPRDVPDAGGIPARISSYETDVQADPENFSRVDLQAGTDMKIESYKRGAATLRDLVFGVDDGLFTEAERIKKTETVVNEQGIATMDFRVEGDTDPFMIFVDASVDRVGIGEGVPTSTLDVDGSLALPTSAISSTITADGTQHTLLVDATGASRTINLPAAAGVPGRIYVVKKIDSSANTVVVDPAGAELIDGAATKTLSAQWDSIKIQSDGVSWFIVADKIASGGGSGVDVKDEGVFQGTATILDFVGAGVTATFAGSTATITVGGPLTVTAHTVDATLTSADSGTVHTNEGAVAGVALTLPSAVAGLHVYFQLRAAFSLRIKPGAGDSVEIAGTSGTTQASSSLKGNTVHFIALNATEWVAQSSVGPWSIT